MSDAPTTIIIRHRKEKLEKCSLHGLESRADLSFHTFDHFPEGEPPDMRGMVMLTMDGPPLDASDAEIAGRSLVLIDGTWRLEQRIRRAMHRELFFTIKRSISDGWVTAYPRRQTECPDPERGLASVEALYVAHLVMGYDTDGLLDHYRWGERFLELNAAGL